MSRLLVAIATLTLAAYAQQNPTKQSAAPQVGTSPTSAVAPQTQPAPAKVEETPKPVPAEYVYKNIHIFKGEPATKLLPAMEGITQDLGVDCTYCHNPHHWEDDHNDAKLKARDMFRMALSINDDLFEGKSRVSCGTCHRGEAVPDHFPKPKEVPQIQLIAEKVMALPPEQAQLPAEKVFKNIQVMKDVPAGQFPSIMAYFSQSLGVKCAFCHVNPFAKDEKPQKLMARKMLKMVQGTRTFYHGGSTPVECWTCHRGQEKPPESAPAALVAPAENQERVHE